MSIGKSEKQTWGRAVYPGWGVCVCADGASDGAEEIFSEFFPVFGKERKVESLLSGESAPRFPSFCNPVLCPCISGNQVLFLPWHSPHRSGRVCILFIAFQLLHCCTIMT